MRGQAGSICENKPPFLPPSICRVTTYARSCLIKTDENVINLGKALYLYNRAAIAAFGE